MLAKLRSPLVCAIVSLAICTVSRLAAETFSNPLRIPTPVDPTSVLVGDLNGDGRPDIVWGDTSTSPFVLHVLLAQPGGGFLPAPNITLPAQTSTLCQIGDFNLDGHPDIVCGAGINTIGVQMFLGNGDGTFQPPISSFLQNGPSPANFSAIFASGDLNGDGFPDLIVSYAPYAPSYVFLGNGKGSFTAALNLNGGNNGSEFPIVADLNGDGKPDIFLPSGPEVEVATGGGSFGPLLNSSSNSYFTAVCTLHDMDGDGHPDAVCGAPGGYIDIDGTTQLVILHGNPDGSFNTSPILTKVFGDGNTEYDGMGTFYTPFYVGDVNGDGIPDILANSGDGTAVLLGGPGLTFSTPLHYAQAVSQNAVLEYSSVVADMNGDGIPDIVACGPNGIYISYGRRDGSFASAFAPEVTENIGYATVADFNGDGIPDVAATGDTAIKLSLGKGDGTFAAPVALPNNNGAINFATPLSAMNAHILHGDFNGDGKQDILAIGSSGIYSYDSYVLFGNGDGTFNSPLLVPNSSTQYPMYSALSDAAVVDINHDGRSDIMSMNANSVQPASLTFALSNGNGTFTSVSTPVASDPEGNGFLYPNTQPALADFNSDGKLDAVYGSLNNVYIVLGNGDGTFASNSVALPIPSLAGQIVAGALSVATGDFDGDGNQDFVALVQYDSAQYSFSGIPDRDLTAAWVYYGNGNGSFSSPVLAASFNRSYSGIAVADLNRDGLADIVAKTSGSLGGGHAVGVLHSQPGRTFGPEINYTAGTGLSSLAITDVNRDGYPDMVFANGDYNIRASSVTVLLNSGLTSTSSPTLAGSLTASPEPSIPAQPFTLTATLSPSTPGDTLTGSVSFSIDGASIGSAPLSANAATLAGPATLAAGVHQLSATWSGSATYPPITLAGSHTVLASTYAAQLLLGSSLSPSLVNQPITLTAQVLGQNGNPTPTGAVAFSDGSTPLGAFTLNASGKAAVTFTPTTVGLHTITAAYTATSSYPNLSATYPQQVDSASTAVLTVTPTSAIAGSPITLTTTVSPNPIGSATPAGSVIFSSNGSPLTTAPISSGVAAFTTSSLPVGVDSLTCTYSGDGTYLPSTCNVVPVSIAAVTAALTLTSSANPAPALTSITFTMQVAAGSGGAITLALAGQTLTFTPNAAGTATYTTSTLAAGTYVVTAIWRASQSALAAQATLTQVVTGPQATPDFTLTGPNSLSFLSENSGSAPIAVTSLGGFSGSIDLSCGGEMPPTYTCTLSPASVPLSGGGVSSATLLLQPTVHVDRAGLSHSNSDRSAGIVLASFLPLTLLSLTGFARRRLRMVLTLACLAGLAGATTACNFSDYPTPVGTFPITLTATGTAHGSSTLTIHTLDFNVVLTH